MQDLLVKLFDKLTQNPDQLKEVFFLGIMSAAMILLIINITFNVYLKRIAIPRRR